MRSVQVSGPTRPSTRRPRRCWNALTAASVVSPKRPSNSPASIEAPSATRRCWTSRTSSPREPERMMRMLRSLRLAESFDKRNGDSARGLSGDVRVDLLEDRVLAAGADDAGLLLSGDEDDECGDRHDAVLARHLGVLIDVQLHDRKRLAFVASDLLDDRRDHVARHAPLR